jgi:hypothetical protein
LRKEAKRRSNPCLSESKDGLLRSARNDEAMQKKLFVIQARDPATQRIINRLWTRVKTGK